MFSHLQGSVTAMELACRIERFDVYRDNLHESNKLLKKHVENNSTLVQCVGQLEVELTLLRDQKARVDKIKEDVQHLLAISKEKLH